MFVELDVLFDKPQKSPFWKKDKIPKAASTGRKTYYIISQAQEKKKTKFPSAISRTAASIWRFDIIFTTSCCWRLPGLILHSLDTSILPLRLIWKHNSPKAPTCRRSAAREPARPPQMASTISKIPSLNSAIRWKMPKTPLTKARRDTRYYGLYSKSATSVSSPCILWFPPSLHLRQLGEEADCSRYVRWIGSRYIYDLYYEKEAISKKLYDWLLKNGYADANLIAKWKKQGYEKVRLGTGVLTRFEGIKLTLYSCVVYDAFRPKKPISTLLVYVVFRRRSWKKTREYSVWAAGVAGAVVVIETNLFILKFWLELGFGLGRGAPQMDRQVDRRVWRPMSVLSLVYADARSRVCDGILLFFFLSLFRWSGCGVPLFGFQAMMMEFFLILSMCVSAWALYCWFEFWSLAIGFSIFVFL